MEQGKETFMQLKKGSQLVEDFLGTFSDQGGVEILPRLVFDRSLFSPDVIILFENLNTDKI